MQHNYCIKQSYFPLVIHTINTFKCTSKKFSTLYPYFFIALLTTGDVAYNVRISFSPSVIKFSTRNKGHNQDKISKWKEKFTVHTCKRKIWTLLFLQWLFRFLIFAVSIRLSVSLNLGVHSWNFWFLIQTFFKHPQRLNNGRNLQCGKLICIGYESAYLNKSRRWKYPLIVLSLPLISAGKQAL